MENDTTFEQSLLKKNAWIDSFFLYSLTWAFGSILTEKARKHFNTWLHEQIKLKNEQRVQAEEARDKAEIDKLMHSNLYIDEEES